MAHTRWLCIGISLLFAACRPAGTDTGQTTLTAARGIVPSGVAGEAERMPHCPSVVPGATTVVGEVPDGVALRITASGVGADEIRKRANYLASVGEETIGKHRASGQGGGQFGRCPIVMRNTKLEVQEVPGGVVVVVRPSDGAELDWLRRESEARSAQLAAPKPFGPGLMKSCPNAVPNTTTRIVEVPHGVELHVTGASPEEIRLIRERARGLASRGLTDARCPAFAPNGLLFVEDTPNGVTMTIKAKYPKDVPGLREDVRRRAESYEPPLLR